MFLQEAIAVRPARLTLLFHLQDGCLDGYSSQIAEVFLQEHCGKRGVLPLHRAGHILTECY
jgi:hypothetical protein